MPFVPDKQGFVPDESPEPNPLDYLSAATRFSLPRLGIEANKILSDALEKFAYKTGGAVTDVTGSPVAGWLANTAVQSLPMVAGGSAAKIAAPAIEAGARKLMASAVKPNLEQWKSGDAKKAIDTLFAQGLNPTEGGVEVLKKKIGALNDEIAKAISGSSESVTVGAAGKPLLDTLRRFENQVAPQDDLAAIVKVWSMYRNHPALGGKTDMPIQLAQQLKQGTYRQIDKKYGELGAAETEAQKAVARGLKEEIAAKAPEVAPLNEKESELINALNVIERRAMLDLNKNPMSLALLAHNPASFAAYMADKSALFKSLTARMLNAGKEQIPATATRLGITGVQAIQPQGPQ